MAPRTSKVKKASEGKIAETEAPKKGRGKAKNIEDVEQEITEIQINGTATTEKKPKRGRKALESNDQDENIDINADSAPAPKKIKKKTTPEPSENSNDISDKEESPTPQEEELNEESEEVNGHAEEVAVTNGKEKKKQTKKNIASEKSAASKTGRTKKTLKQESDEADDKEKPKTATKGKGRKAQAKTEKVKEEKTEDAEEESNPDAEEDSKPVPEEEKAAPPAAKGRKKAQPKTVKEKSDTELEKDIEQVAEEKPLDEPKKKEAKGKKNQSKKAQTKVEVDDKEELAVEEPSSKKKKTSKKEEKGQGDSIDEEPAESKPAKGKRGQKKAVETATVAETEPQDTGESTSKRRRKAPEEKAPVADSKKKAPLKNKATTNYENIDFSNNSRNQKGKEWNFKIASWNVDGIRAWMSKGGLDYIKFEKPDIICLQEVKCSQEKLPNEVAELPGYHAYWLCSDQDGYAGVGIYTTKLAMNVQYGLQNEELDSEGRIITAEYEEFYLICTYVPNAGRKLVTLPKRLEWNEEFRRHVKELDKKKPVIICGDMNVAHNEIDLTNPKTNKKNAGFTNEERAGMTDLLSDGFVDIYRHLNPDKTGAFTFWTYMMNCRAKNVGWRLDYFIASERLMPSICDSDIRSEVYGSDHCPIALFLHLTSAEKPKDQ